MADIGKSLLPVIGSVYDFAKLGGNVEGVPFLTSLGLGSNMAEQWDNLLRLPAPQFKEVISKLTDNFKDTNPSIGIRFLSAGFAQSTSDRLLQDILPAIDIGTAGVGTGLASRIKSLNTVRDITKDVVKSASSIEVDKSTIDASIEDLGESTIQKLTANGIAMMK